MEQMKMGVRMDEWFFTQGLAGYKTILEDYGESVKTTYDGIVVERRHLEVFPDAFFAYYLNQYSVAEREERIIRGLHKKFKEDDASAKRDLNTRLNKIKVSVNRYFKDTEEGKRLGDASDQYRIKKKYERHSDELINEFIDMIGTKEIDEKLTSNFFKAVHLTPYFGQVSVLNVTHNKKTLEEQKEIFKKDFILPIIEEWKLYYALEINDEQKVNSILDDTNYTLFNPIKRAFKKKDIDGMREYVDQEVYKCSLTDFPIGLLSFEEGVFSPLSLSLNNARNMSWDANHKSFLPICSLARLMIFCSQAGATDSQGRSVFVYYGGSFDEIYQTNKSYADLKSSNKTFDQIIFDLVREQKVKADYLKNRYIIYEYESDYQAKKTILNYMIMTPNLMKLFSEDHSLFNYMHYTIKSEMIRYLLQNIDPKNFISLQLRNKIKNNYSVQDVIQLVQIRHLNQYYLKEELNMDSTIEKRRVWALVKSAEQVKYKIGIKKAQGIAYRLLNAVRSNDKNTFMDTVMRVYISSDIEMPGILLEVLHEEKMDFATVGNAWIAGLVSKSNNEEKGEDKNE